MSGKPMQASTPAETHSQAAPTDAHIAQNRRELVREISSTWGKFSEDDLAALKDNDDLTQQVADKYGIPREDAARDVAALLKGRVL
jgi:hypothetical protein